MRNLTQLRDHPEIYTAINQMAEALAQGLRQALPGCTVNQVGSLVCPFFTPGPVTDFATARQSDTGRYPARPIQAHAVPGHLPGPGPV